MRHGNLLAEIPDELPDELTQVLLERGSLRIERIVSRGHSSPTDFWYDQNELEWVLLISGRASLWVEGEAQPRELGPGDWIELPPHRRHRVDSTSAAQDTVWLAIFTS